MRRRVTRIGLDCLPEGGQGFVVVEVVSGLHSLRAKRDRRRMIGSRRRLDRCPEGDTDPEGYHRPERNETVHAMP